MLADRGKRDRQVHADEHELLKEIEMDTAPLLHMIRHAHRPGAFPNSLPPVSVHCDEFSCGGLAPISWKTYFSCAIDSILRIRMADLYLLIIIGSLFASFALASPE